MQGKIIMDDETWSAFSLSDREVAALKQEVEEVRKEQRPDDDEPYNLVNELAVGTIPEGIRSLRLKQKKSATGAATPSGAKENNSQSNYNIQIPVEQEKMDKIMELIRLAIEINGMDCRKQDTTGKLPTSFAWYSGHASLVDFSVCRDGWFSGSTGESKVLYITDPISRFNEEYKTIKCWLLEVKQEAANEQLRK